jgi:uncharacterized membrane protein
MKSRALLIATLASSLAIPALVLAGNQKTEGGKEVVHCYGVNKCKGVGDCGGKGHSCAGQNACKGQGYLDMSQDLCLKIDGGRLTPNAEKK